jgi:tripartite-type tricarboxylate transporter receptor subunit TctC
LPFDTRKASSRSRRWAAAQRAGGRAVVGIKSVQELIAQASESRAQSISRRGFGQRYSRQRGGSSSSQRASTVVHIPYKGTPEALTDTIAGRVTYYFSRSRPALPPL